ncbi:hypothetical protein KY290_030681 [Solanum tuberosum]|uniref:Cytochrome P450 n=1 Tax=Solanum tuberosum TaxID=4113 RepID=A0ABQ7U8A2_SOLTU|nr:hypothetical protein KY289_029919 [Solanum tuberosum]KAH0654867.1 hypothetical protein KY285_029749 [Solanum tuberosum]KAH0742688.1 hypothetical protein KY290_030681 [Solanum tuberosum]
MVSERLVPILANAAAEKKVVDIQDILQRFAFDNICKIAFGYDPEYLLPNLPEAEFAVAFEDCVRLSSERFIHPFPLIWKIKRVFGIGSEKKLRIAVEQVRRDTTSAALTWFFWLISKNPEAESEILKEIGEKEEDVLMRYDEVKNMMYTHASLCESMRFYPPVPMDSKEAVKDDVLPDGTFVKKGTRVTYHPYAMGRSEEIWGEDWAEFKPERWLNKDEMTGNWMFVGKDAFTYPVFQAGPRVCLGKEMAFLQMKRVVAGVLQRFKVVPVAEKGVEPMFISYLTAKMKGGFPVTIEERM